MLSDPRAVMLLDRYATYTGSDPRKAPVTVLATVPTSSRSSASGISGAVWARSPTLFTSDASNAGSMFEPASTSPRSRPIRPVSPASSRTVRITSATWWSRASMPGFCAPTCFDDACNQGSPIHRPNRSAWRGFVLLLALRGRTPGLQHHNVWFPEDYDAEFDAIFGRAPRPVEDPAIYVCSPDDPEMRPDSDHESWFVLINAPRHDPAGGVDWTSPGLAEGYAQRILELLAQRGVDVRDRVCGTSGEAPRISSAQRGLRADRFGTASNGPRAAFARPTNASLSPACSSSAGLAPRRRAPLVGMGAEITASLVGRGWREPHLIRVARYAGSVPNDTSDPVSTDGPR